MNGCIGQHNPQQKLNMADRILCVILAQFELYTRVCPVSRVHNKLYLGIENVCPNQTDVLVPSTA